MCRWFVDARGMNPFNNNAKKNNQTSGLHSSFPPACVSVGCRAPPVVFGAAKPNAKLTTRIHHQALKSRKVKLKGKRVKKHTPIQLIHEYRLEIKILMVLTAWYIIGFEVVLEDSKRRTVFDTTWCRFPFSYSLI